MLYREFRLNRIFQGRLKKGSDLVEGLKAFLKGHSIQAGIISGIGAVIRAKIGYFDQKSREYRINLFDEPLEIISLKGNVSLKDEDVFSHLHGVFSRENGSCIGGHIFEGTEVYAFEFEIIELKGDAFNRHFDDETGLYLWKE